MIMNEKSCQIFKNGNVVKIVTAYKLDIGYYRLSVPIYVLDISMGIKYKEFIENVLKKISAEKILTN